MEEADEEAKFELEDYNSEDDDKSTRTAALLPSDQGLSSRSLQLMERSVSAVYRTCGLCWSSNICRLGFMFKASKENEELLTPDEIKIFYCSRTHSQLTQIVQELRRVDLPASSWVTEKDDHEANKLEAKVVVKHVPLGSRKNLCINPKVSELGSVSAINERCLELQQPDTPKDHKCPFLPNKENETLVNDFRDHTLARIRDIEDLGSLGRKIGICPYYASRATIKPSEVSPTSFESYDNLIEHRLLPCHTHYSCRSLPERPLISR